MKWLVLLFSLSSVASAAQNAQIIGPGGALKKYPRPSAETLESLPEGTALEVSNVPSQGFYRVRTSEGNLGWVAAQSILVGQEIPPPEDEIPPVAQVETKISVEPPVAPPAETRTETIFVDQADGNKRSEMRPKGKIWISGFWGIQHIHLSDLSSLLANPLYSWEQHYGVQVDFPMTERLYWSFRAENMTGSVSAGSEVFSASSFPISSGISYRLIEDRFFQMRLTALLGIGFSTRFDATATQLAAPNLTELSAAAFEQIIKLDQYFNVGKWTAFYFEMGYRNIASPSTGPTTLGNGSASFQVNGQYKPVSINLSGPMASMGIALRL
jgi:hypothetical protein